jgi:amino acid transporter
VLSYVNFRGIRESMWVNLLCTAVEVGGLLLVIAVGMRYWGGVDYLQTPPADPAAADAGRQGLNLWLISSGAVLTFFSFIGFEDMLNVSEEVRRPEFNVPWGIVIALAIATVLYLAVAVTAVSVVDYRDLGNTELGAPLQQITAKAAPWLPGWVYGFITLFAVANTVLINYIMGSRLLFGMSRQGLLPPVLGRVHATRRTPHIAILVLMIIVIGLAMVRNISQLAAATSLLLLCVFCIINSALIVLKLRPGEARGQFEVPLVIPICGVLACFGLIAARLSSVMQDQNWIGVVIAVVIVLVAATLFFITQPKAIEDEPTLL